nr:type II toxin-antitoxin system prevent-host-death family antitoxin [uncultured Rhodopila sp.]
MSTAEAQRDFSALQQRARTEPVTVTDNGLPVAVLMSFEEYRRLKRRDRQAIRVEMLDDATLEALAATEPPEEAARYDFEAR